MNKSETIEKKEISEIDLQRQSSKVFSCSEDKKSKLLFRDLVQMGFNANFIQRSLTKHKVDNLNDAVEMMIKVDEKYLHRFKRRKEDNFCDICEDVIENHLEFKPWKLYVNENSKDFTQRYLTSNIKRSNNDNSYEQVRVRSLQIENNFNINNFERYNFSERYRKSIGDSSEKYRLNYSLQEKKREEGVSKNVWLHDSDRSFLKKKLEDVIICGICLGEIEMANKLFKLDCEDMFCDDCLKEHIKEEIINSRVLMLKCPKQDCKMNIKEEKIKEIIEDKELIEKYKRFRKFQLLKADPNIKFCPITDCDGYDEFNEDLSKQNICKKLICQKNHEFCSICNKTWHEGRNCEDEIKDELEVWIKQNNLKIRQCHKCKAYIEKNLGCNHMTCINCKYMFCWLCNKEYTTNHYEQRGFCYNKQFWDPDNPSQNQLYYGDAVNLFLNRNLQRDPNILMNNVIGNENIMRLNLWNGNFIYQMFYMFSFASHSLSRSVSWLHDIFYYFLFFISHFLGNLFIIIALYKNTVYFRKYLSSSYIILFLYYLTGMCIWIYSYIAIIGSSIIIFIFGITNSAIINILRDSPEVINERNNAARALENLQNNHEVPNQPIVAGNLIPQIEMVEIPREENVNNNIQNNEMVANNNEFVSNPDQNIQNEVQVKHFNENNTIINDIQPYRIIPLESIRENSIKIVCKEKIPVNLNIEEKIDIVREIPHDNLSFNNISHILSLENESPIKSESPSPLTNKNKNDLIIFRKQNTFNSSHYTINQNNIINNNNIILSINGDIVNNNEIKIKNRYSLEIKGNNYFNSEKLKKINKNKLSGKGIQNKNITFINYRTNRINSLEINNKNNKCSSFTKEIKEI